jgi:hypothetical protein
VLRAEHMINDNSGDPMPHYPDHHAVLEALAAAAGTDADRHTDQSVVLWMQRLPASCLAVSCDDCGAAPTNDDVEGRIVHFTEMDQARAYLDDWEWAGDSPIRCRWCRARRADWTACALTA